MSDRVTAVRGDLVFCTGDPRAGDFVHVEDGIVVSRDGDIVANGPAHRIVPTLPADAEIAHYPGCLVAPGFVDAHVHYAQTEMIGTPGGRLVSIAVCFHHMM